MNIIKNYPLVSVGVPTFNRPEFLARALDSLINQSYSNIEIIVSDNNSSDPRVATTIKLFTDRDKRISAIKQVTNVGAANNFFHVLDNANANYFMWAADDDYIEPWFIEKCLEKLLDNATVALVATEAQYIVDGGRRLPFVAEGGAFRSPLDTEPVSRIKYLLKYNYGNLVYGLFRKNALMQDGKAFWGKTSLQSTNEVPALLLAAMKGEIIVLPDIGLYKYVPETVYSQVVWENSGGWLPSTGRISGLHSLIQTWRYHWHAMLDVESGVKLLPLKPFETRSIFWASRWYLFRHFIYLVLCYKPRRTVENHK